MGFLLKISAATLVGLLIAISSACWAGRQARVELLPPPSPDGCWQGICLEALKPEDTLAVMRAQPGISPDSLQLVRHLSNGDYSVGFRYTPPGGHPVPMLLLASSLGIVLTRDFRSPEPLPLMRLGDLVQHYGPPDSLIVLDTTVMLQYPQYRLWVVISPRSSSPTVTRLLPGDAVNSLTVYSNRAMLTSGLAYYSATVAWKGFGPYEH